MIAAWVAISLALSQSADGAFTEFASFGVNENRIAVHVPAGKLPVAKVSPKNNWTFEWGVDGLGRKDGGDTPYELRVRVFCQHEVADGRAQAVARMAMRLWDFNYQRLQLDHSSVYNSRIVDIYLCDGGKPGGEQLFSEDKEGGRPHKVDTIYIYDLPSFDKPLEMAREVAHEYGHASLPPVGIFAQPEDWANGFLGEKLFLRWIRNAMAVKKLTPDDAMGATLEQLDAWVKRYVDRPTLRAALSGPDPKLLAGKGSGSMGAYIGLALYAEASLPRSVFARSLKLIGSINAVDYPGAVVAAVEEANSFVFRVPSAPAGKAFWVPLGRCGLRGGKILARRQGWAQVRPTGGTIKIASAGGGS